LEELRTTYFANEVTQNGDQAERSAEGRLSKVKVAAIPSSPPNKNAYESRLFLFGFWKGFEPRILQTK